MNFAYRRKYTGGQAGGAGDGETWTAAGSEQTLHELGVACD